MTRNKGLFFLIGSLLVLGAALPGAAVAETWNWTLETIGGNVTWTSPTSVGLKWSRYDYTSEFTRIDALIFGNWGDITKEFGDTKTESYADVLPFDIVDMQVDEAGMLKCHLYHGVDEFGKGQFSITDVQFLGFITGLRATGYTRVVPEPAGIVMLLSLAAAFGVAVLKRRWR